MVNYAYTQMDAVNWPILLEIFHSQFMFDWILISLYSSSWSSKGSKCLFVYKHLVTKFGFRFMVCY